MSVELDIITALNSHAVSLTLPDGVALVFANYGYDPNAEKYVKVDTLPRETDAPFLDFDSALDYGGIYQLSVHTKLNWGETESSNIADAIIAHFKRGTALSSGNVNLRLGQAYRSPPMITDTHYTVVVSVPYRAIIKPALFN